MRFGAIHNDLGLRIMNLVLKENKSPDNLLQYFYYFIVLMEESEFYVNKLVQTM